MPRHSHELNDPGHSHLYDKSIDGRGYQTQADDDPHGAYDQTETESTETGITMEEVGGNEPIDLRQPFFTVHKLMKI